VRMDFYTAEDIARIIRRTASILQVRVEEEAVVQLAGSSRGTPRVANRLLRRMRDFAQVLADGEINTEVVGEGLQRL